MRRERHECLFVKAIAMKFWPLIVLPVASLLRGSTFKTLDLAISSSGERNNPLPTAVKVLIFDFEPVEPSQEANFQISGQPAND